MSRFRTIVVSTFMAALFTGPASANDDPLLEPVVSLAIPFGGVRAATAGAQLSAQLVYRAGGVPVPATLEYRLDGQRSSLALMGLPLAAGGGYRVDADGGQPTGGPKVARAVGMGAATTVVIGGLAFWALIEGLEEFGEAFGDGMSEAVAGAFTGGGSGEGGDSESPACTGVQVGEECITAAGGGGG